MALAKNLNQLFNEAQAVSAKCPVGRIIENLNDEDRLALVRVLGSAASTRSIHQALRHEGFSIERQSVTLHRKGYCRCKEVQGD